MEGPVRMFLQKSQKDGLAEWQSPPVRGVTSGLLPLLNGPEGSYISFLGFLVLSHLPRTLSPLPSLFPGPQEPYMNVLSKQENFFFLKNSSTDEPLKLPGVNCGLPHGGKGSGSQSAWYQKGLERENGGGHSLSSACFQSICSCAEFSLLFYPFRNSDIDSCQHRAGFHLLQERVQAVNLVICPEQQSIWVAFSFLEVCLPKQSLYMSPCTPVLLGLLI